MRNQERDNMGQECGKQEVNSVLRIPGLKPLRILLVEDSADDALLVDRNGIVQFASPAAETLFRRTHMNLSGSSLALTPL